VINASQTAISAMITGTAAKIGNQPTQVNQNNPRTKTIKRQDHDSFNPQLSTPKFGE
jgi:hypothetical protein